jgi:Protein of unknown function (DUF5672)
MFDWGDIIYKEMFNTIEDCENYLINELPFVVKTEFVLIIQNDGYILNPHLWDKNFLNYDYIGAPWHHVEKIPNKVGNGGFCLRSLKLMKAVSKLGYNAYNGIEEDWYVSNNQYNYLTNLGLKFAPVEVAEKFSLEVPKEGREWRYDNVFGFHGGKFPQAQHLVL